jgi:hypothetical protein
MDTRVLQVPISFLFHRNHHRLLKACAGRGAVAIAAPNTREADLACRAKPPGVVRVSPGHLFGPGQKMSGKTRHERRWTGKSHGNHAPRGRTKAELLKVDLDQTVMMTPRRDPGADEQRDRREDDAEPHQP